MVSLILHELITYIVPLAFLQNLQLVVLILMSHMVVLFSYIHSVVYRSGPVLVPNH